MRTFQNAVRYYIAMRVWYRVFMRSYDDIGNINYAGVDAKLAAHAFCRAFPFKQAPENKQ